MTLLAPRHINVRKDQYWHSPETGAEVLVTSVSLGSVYYHTVLDPNNNANAMPKQVFMTHFHRGKRKADWRAPVDRGRFSPGHRWMNRSGTYFLITANDGQTISYKTMYGPSYDFTLTLHAFGQRNLIYVGGPEETNNTVERQSNMTVQVDTQAMPIPQNLAVPPAAPLMDIVVGATYLAKSDGMPVEVDILRQHNVVFHSSKRFYTYDHTKFRNLFDRAPALTPVAKPSPQENKDNTYADAEKERVGKSPQYTNIHGVPISELEQSQTIKDLMAENAKLKELLKQSYAFLARRPAGYSAHMEELSKMFKPAE